MPRTPDDSQSSPWPNDEAWLKLLEPMLLEDASLADLAGRLWCYLIEEIKRGPEGATRARQSLEDALRLTFQFTEAHKACRTLFEMSVAGEFSPEDDPLKALGAAIERHKSTINVKDRKKKQKTTDQSP